MSFVVVEEIVLDRMRSETKTKNEFVMPEVCIIAHDVPQHRSGADRHHWFRHWCIDAGAHPHTEASAKQDHLHNGSLLSVVTAGHSRRGSANSRIAGATGRPTSKPSVVPDSIAWA